MDSTLIGFCGIILGILLNEYFRRRKRIEFLFEQVYKKKLKIYEEFFKILQDSHDVVIDMLEKDNLNREEVIRQLSPAIFRITNYLDKYALYINENIAVHTMCTFIGMDNIILSMKKEERDQLIEQYYEDKRILYNMIRKEMGIIEIEKLSETITKSQHKSRFTEYYKELKKKYKEKGLTVQE